MKRQEMIADFQHFLDTHAEEVKAHICEPPYDFLDDDVTNGDMVRIVFDERGYNAIREKWNTHYGGISNMRREQTNEENRNRTC